MIGGLSIWVPFPNQTTFPIGLLTSNYAITLCKWRKYKWQCPSVNFSPIQIKNHRNQVKSKQQSQFERLNSFVVICQDEKSVVKLAVHCFDASVPGSLFLLSSRFCGSHYAKVSKTILVTIGWGRQRWQLVHHFQLLFMSDTQTAQRPCIPCKKSTRYCPKMAKISKSNRIREVHFILSKRFKLILTYSKRPKQITRYWLLSILISSNIAKHITKQVISYNLSKWS